MTFSRIPWILISFLCVLCLPAIAGNKINIVAVGNNLNMAYTVRNVIQHKDYPDMAVPARTEDNAVIYQVVSGSDKDICAVAMSTEMQSSVANGPYIMASISGNPKGPWIPLYIQRARKEYEFNTLEDRVVCAPAPVYYVKLTFGDCWADGNGHANISLRGLNITVDEIDAVTPEIIFKDRLNVFTDKQPVILSSNRGGMPRIYTLFNNTGQEIKKVEINKPTASVNFGMLEPGFYHLKRENKEVARFCVVAEGIQKHAKYSVAQVDLGYNGPRVPSKTLRLARICQLAGVSIVRERFCGGRELSTIGSSEFRQILKVEREHGLRTTFCFDNLGFGEELRAQGKDLRDLYKNAYKVGIGMKNSIYCYEFRNETDSWPFGGDNANTANRYASALKATYLGLMDADPSGKSYKIATNGISSIDRAEYIDQMLANNIGAYFNIYNTHMYEQPANCPAVSQKHKSLLVKYSLTGKKRWITEASDCSVRIDLSKKKPDWNAEYEVPETDYNTSDIDAVPDDVRDYITAGRIKSWVYASESGWEYYFNYCMLYYNEGSQPFGILAPGITATSTYAGLATYNNLVGHLKYSGRLNLGSDVETHIYSGKNEAVLIVSTKGNEHRINLPAHGDVFAMTGERISSSAKSLLVTANPVFVRLKSIPAHLTAKKNLTELSSRTKSEPSRVILDFERTPAGSRFNVNRRRTFVLEKYGQTIQGSLYIYNLGRKTYNGRLQYTVPKGWSIDLVKDDFQIAPMDSACIPVSITASCNYMPGVMQVKMFTADRRSVVCVPFVFDESLGVKRVKMLDLKTLKFFAVEPSVITPAIEDDKLSMDISYRGVGNNVGFTSDLPELHSNGVYFELKGLKGSPAYIDVAVINKDGSESIMRPNYFPSLMPNTDGISAFAVKYSALTPATDSSRAKSVKIAFSTFGPMDITLGLLNLCVF